MTIVLAENKKIRLLAALVISLFLMVPTIVNGANLEGLQSWLSDNYRTDFNGFIEARAGSRLQTDPYQKDTSIGESRLQVDLSSDLDWVILKFP